jgi:hypothetical protein
MSRKQRRAVAAAAAADSTSAQLTSAADIPLSRPNTSREKGKTLLEIAAERQAQLAPRGQPFPKSTDLPGSTQFVTISPDGKITDSAPTDHKVNDADTAEPASPVLDTIFLALPLSCLHFTLSFLTAHQYAQELHLLPIILNTVFVAFPTLTLVIHLVHGHLLGLTSVTIPKGLQTAATVAQQILFLLAANIAGCYLIHLTNDKGYYAVMKKAPSIGTVWVWSIIELGLAGALAGVAGPGLYAWWNGYGVW